MEGKFVLAKNENYEAFLKAIDVPAELAARMAAAKPVLEACKTGSGLTVKTTAGDKTFSNTITFGQDSAANIAGNEYTLNVNETPSGYSGTMTIRGKKGTNTTEKTADGMVQTLCIDGVVAKRHYKKM